MSVWMGSALPVSSSYQTTSLCHNNNHEEGEEEENEEEREGEERSSHPTSSSSILSWLSPTDLTLISSSDHSLYSCTGCIIQYERSVIEILSTSIVPLLLRMLSHSSPLSTPLSIITCLISAIEVMTNFVQCTPPSSPAISPSLLHIMSSLTTINDYTLSSIPSPPSYSTTTTPHSSTESAILTTQSILPYILECTEGQNRGQSSVYVGMSNAVCAVTHFLLYGSPLVSSYAVVGEREGELLSLLRYHFVECVLSFLSSHLVRVFTRITVKWKVCF
jgi:hypothetical protein